MPIALETDLSNLADLPPGLRFELGRALDSVDPDGSGVRELWRLFESTESWLGLAPTLAEVGYQLLDASYHHRLRRFACAWLTRFPTEQTMQRLAQVALDPETLPNVREQAAWTLGYRQSRGQPASVRWSDAAVETADRALIELTQRATDTGELPFEDLPIALRHVQAPQLFEVLGRDLPLWGGAIEAFATPEFARLLLERLQEIPNDHQLRAMRLAADTLGEEAVPQLLAQADSGGSADQLELRFLALSVGGAAQMDDFEAAVAPLRSADLLRQRAQWHLAHPGVVPTVRAMKTARTTALMPGEERTAACAEAADDLAALTPFLRHPEHYLYTLWAQLVIGAGDLDRARTLATARPECRKQIKSLYLQDLARRGRAKQVVAAAQMLEGVEEGAYWLAIYGRPFMALELAATSRLNTPRLAVARVLGLYRAGRPDLAARVLAEELPPSAVTSLDEMPTFPGDEERWLAEKHAIHDAAVTALVGGLDAVLALAQPAPADSEKDSFSFETVAVLERWLARPIDGATVYLAGEFPDDTKAQHTDAILERGGRLMDGPFPGTHYYVMGLTCLVTTVAQLERQATRRIRNEELGLSW